MNDSKLKEVMDLVIKYRDNQGWEINDTPLSLAKSITIEASELLKNFLTDKHFDMDNVKEELADVLMYAITLCYEIQIDVEREISLSLAKKAKTKLK